LLHLRRWRRRVGLLVFDLLRLRLARRRLLGLLPVLRRYDVGAGEDRIGIDARRLDDKWKRVVEVGVALAQLRPLGGLVDAVARDADDLAGLIVQEAVAVLQA